MKQYLGILRTLCRVLAVIVLLVTTFVFAMFQGGFVSWFLFYSFIPFGLYSLFITFIPVLKMDVNRETNQDIYMAGEQFIGTITIERKHAFPLFYLLVEEVLPPEVQHCQQSKKAKVIFAPVFKKRLTYQYQIDSIPRGEHVFTKIRVKTGDLFGLVEKEVFYNHAEIFIVYPKYHQMTYKQIEGGFDQGQTTSNASLQRNTTIAVGTREYKPGDRFSWIDWKSSARKSNLMVKEFEQQQSYDVVIFIDRTNSQQFEEVVTLTTSLVRAILKKGAEVSFISVGEKSLSFPLKGGDYQFQQIYYHLAKVKADGIHPFSKTIQSKFQGANQNVTFMLVTSQLTFDLISVIQKASIKRAKVLLFVVKGRGSKLSKQENEIIGGLKNTKVEVEVVYEGQYQEVIQEVNKT